MAKAKKKKRKKVNNRTRLTEWGTSERDERFCQEFIRDYNASQAMLRAGHKGSMNSVRVAGCMALRRKAVRDRIDMLQKEVFDQCKSSLALVVNELMSIVFFDWRRIATYKGGVLRLKDSDKMSLEDARMIESIDMRFDATGQPVVKFKRASRMDALKTLALLHKDVQDGNDIRERARSLRFAFEAMGLEQVPPKEERE